MLADSGSAGTRKGGLGHEATRVLAGLIDGNARADYLLWPALRQAAMRGARITREHIDRFTAESPTTVDRYFIGRPSSRTHSG